MVDSLCVRITNQNDFEEPIRDFHDGVEYTFPKGRPVTIPLEAAVHIFGFDANTGRASFAHVQRRWGWNVLDTKSGQGIVEGTAKHAKEWFANLIVEPVILKQMEIPPSISQAQLEEAIARAQIVEPNLPAG